jgi:mono/diheme cytochrome c family protein
MKIFRSVFLLLPALLGSALYVSAQGNVQIKKVPPPPTTAISGKVLFSQYCAVCHGVDGKGAGPAASALKQGPGDLTLISRGNGGRFPEERFRKIIDGDATLVVHGTQDMPIWGPAFRSMSNNANLTQNRIFALLDYVEGLQTK